MKNIVYIGKYNGIIGGIERYMQKSAELLRRNGLLVHYLYYYHYCTVYGNYKRF